MIWKCLKSASGIGVNSREPPSLVETCVISLPWCDSANSFRTLLTLCNLAKQLNWLDWLRIFRNFVAPAAITRTANRTKISSVRVFTKLVRRHGGAVAYRYAPNEPIPGVLSRQTY